MSKEEAIKTIEELLRSNEPICEYMLKHQEIEAMQKLLNIIETQKAELEKYKAIELKAKGGAVKITLERLLNLQAELKKKDKIIDKMAEDIFLMNGDRGCTRQEKIEYFTRLVEGEKKDGNRF